MRLQNLSSNTKDTDSFAAFLFLFELELQKAGVLCKPQTYTHIYTRAMAPWGSALPWLCKPDHVTTPEEASAIATYAQTHPQHLAITDLSGWLPLHIAARTQRGEHSVAVVTTLLAGYSFGAKAAGYNGRLPLHCAAEGQKGAHGVAVVAALLTAFPPGAKTKDSNGALPLHRAAISQKGEHAADIVHALLMAYPEGAAEEEKGFLPLHLAVRHESQSASVVSALLAAFPQAVRERTNGEWLPLHFAAAKQRGEHGVGVVLALLKANPLAVGEKDKEGYLPLHVATEHQVSFFFFSLAFLLLTFSFDIVSLEGDGC